MTNAEMRGCWLRLFVLPETAEVIARGEQTTETL